MLPPQEGKIFLNDLEITHGNRICYSNRISAIFTNTYLFEENYDAFDLTPGNQQLAEYISLVKLNDVLKASADSRRFSNKLSKGQQKRVSMIYALLESHDILVLDEWAAEQDPSFKAYFYLEMIPVLKRLGKTVIAVTHDDQYFGYADRILKFEFGTFAEVPAVKPEAAIDLA
jgi:ABC-type siderophore export system fused ATPase/permease subunit